MFFYAKTTPNPDPFKGKAANPPFKPMRPSPRPATFQTWFRRTPLKSGLTIIVLTFYLACCDHGSQVHSGNTSKMIRITSPGWFICTCGDVVSSMYVHLKINIYIFNLYITTIIQHFEFQESWANKAAHWWARMNLSDRVVKEYTHKKGMCTHKMVQPSTYLLQPKNINSISGVEPSTFTRRYRMYLYLRVIEGITFFKASSWPWQLSSCSLILLLYPFVVFKWLPWLNWSNDLWSLLATLTLSILLFPPHFWQLALLKREHLDIHDRIAQILFERNIQKETSLNHPNKIGLPNEKETCACIAILWSWKPNPGPHLQEKLSDFGYNDGVSSA